MFSSEFCEIFENTFFTEHLRVTASAERIGNEHYRRIFVKKHL